MKQINLRLTELTLAAVDELREMVPRNAWIAQAVDEKIARDSRQLYPTTEPPSKSPPNPQAHTGGLLQGHPFKPASPGSMRCTCGKTMGAH